MLDKSLLGPYKNLEKLLVNLSSFIILAKIVTRRFKQALECELNRLMCEGKDWCILVSVFIITMLVLY